MLFRSTRQKGEFRTYRVQGHVRYANGLPASQVKVAAFDNDLNSEQLLGESVTDDGGSYSIEYSRGLLIEPGRGAANLVLRAYDASDSSVGQSSVHYGVQGEATIDLTIPHYRKSLRAVFMWLISRLRGL